MTNNPTLFLTAGVSGNLAAIVHFGGGVVTLGDLVVWTTSNESSESESSKSSSDRINSPSLP